MEQVTKEKKIRVIKEKQIKPKRIKKIKVQSNIVIIRYDPNNIYVKFEEKNINISCMNIFIFHIYSSLSEISSSLLIISLSINLYIRL